MGSSEDKKTLAQQRRTEVKELETLLEGKLRGNRRGSEARFQPGVSGNGL